MSENTSTKQNNAHMQIKMFPDGLPYRLAFQDWKYHVQGVALDAFENTQDGSGHIGLLIPAAEYLARFPAAPNHPYLALIAPLDLPPIANARAISIYERNLARYEEERRVTRTFRSRLLASLDVKTLSDLGTSLERVTITSQQIYAAMNELYGTIIASELELETKKLQKPLGSLSEFDKLVHLHVSLHALSAENGAPISEFDKITFPKTALLPHEEFKIPIQLFEHDKDLNDPERTFNIFRQYMVKAHSELDFHPHKSTTIKGFAGNLNDKKRTRNDEEEVDQETEENPEWSRK